MTDDIQASTTAFLNTKHVGNGIIVILCNT